MQVNRRTSLSLLAGGALLPLIPAGVAQAAPQFPGASRAVLDLYQGDKVIGQHGYEITGGQSSPTVRTTANFKGKVLGFNVAYDLSTIENWQGGALQRLQSSGQLRGQPFTVSAERQGRFLSVVKPNGRDYLTNPAVLPTTYWMSNFINQTEVLDTQRGGILRLQPKALGSGTLAGRRVTGWDMGGDLPIKIYYDRSGTWSGMQFNVFGAKFEYRRVV